MIELYADCDRCRIQGAVVELYDPDAASVHAVEAACSLCLTRWAAGERIAEGIELDDPQGLRDALAKWARREGYSSAAEFVHANFLVEDEEALLRSVSNAVAVETSFDVSGFLFSGQSGSAEPAQDLPQGKKLEVKPGPPTKISLPAPRAYAQGNALYALMSVMAADGALEEPERRYIASYAAARGLQFNLAVARVYRPDEVGDVGPLREREALIECMVELAMVDGESDESELRVIETYARAWGVDPLRIDRSLARFGRRYESPFRRLLRRVVEFLFPAPA